MYKTVFHKNHSFHGSSLIDYLNIFIYFTYNTYISLQTVVTSSYFVNFLIFLQYFAKNKIRSRPFVDFFKYSIIFIFTKGYLQILSLSNLVNSRIRIFEYTPLNTHLHLHRLYLHASAARQVLPVFLLLLQFQSVLFLLF